MSIKYFAYGSNMSSKRFIDRISNAKYLTTATANDKEIVFNKVSKDGTGKTNLIDRKGGIAWGVVFEISDADVFILDKYERGYNRVTISVTSANGECLEVQTYISQLIDNSLLPTRDYLQYLLDGAQEFNFPVEYLEKLLKTKVH